MIIEPQVPLKASCFLPLYSSLLNCLGIIILNNIIVNITNMGIHFYNSWIWHPSCPDYLKADWLLCFCSSVFSPSRLPIVCTRSSVCRPTNLLSRPSAWLRTALSPLSGKLSLRAELFPDIGFRSFGNSFVIQDPISSYSTWIKCYCHFHIYSKHVLSPQ